MKNSKIRKTSEDGGVIAHSRQFGFHDSDFLGYLGISSFVIQARHLALATLLAAPPAMAADEKITFQDHVLPAIGNTCHSCHNADKKKGGLDLASMGGIMAGGSGGPVVEPGNPGGSRLLKILRQEMEPKMPPDGPALDAKSIALVEKWIAGGMPETKDSKPAAKKSGPNLSFTAKAGKPDGPPAMPEWLSIEPFRSVARQGPITALAASPWAPLLAIGGERQISFYHLDTLEPLGVLDFPEGGPYVLRFSRDGRWLLAAGGIGAKSGRMVVWDVSNGRRKLEFGQESDALLVADARPDFSQVALGGPARKVKLYRQDSPTAFQEIKKHTDWLTAGAYSPDGVLLATGDRNGGVQVWESDTQAEFHSLRGHEKAITATAWRPDGNLLVTASEDGTLRFWDINSGSSVKNFSAHPGGVLDANWSQDGQIVSAGRDKKIKVWKSDGTLTKEWVAGEDAITRIAFAHDGKRVASGDFLGRVRLWSTTGEKLGELTPNPPTVAERIASDTKARDEALAQTQTARQTLAAATAARAPGAAELATLKSKVPEADQLARQSANQRDQKRALMEKLAAEIPGREKETAAKAAEVQSASLALAESNKVLATKTKEKETAATTHAAALKSRDQTKAAREKAVAARDTQPANLSLRDQADAAEKLWQQSESAFSQTEEKLRQASSAYQTVFSQREATQKRLNLAKSEEGKARQILGGVRGRHETAAKDLAAATAKADESAKAFPPLKARLAEVEKALPALVKSESEAKAKVDKISNELAAIESRLRRWRAEPRKLEIRSAQERCFQLEESLAQARANLKDHEATLAKAIARRDAARQAMIDGRSSARWHLLVEQAGVNFARQQVLCSQSHVETVENSLTRERAMVKQLAASFNAPPQSDKTTR